MSGEGAQERAHWDPASASGIGMCTRSETRSALRLTQERVVPQALWEVRSEERARRSAGARRLSLSAGSFDRKSALVTKHERVAAGLRGNLYVTYRMRLTETQRKRVAAYDGFSVLIPVFLCTYICLFSAAIFLGSNTAMSRPEPKPRRCETRTVDQQKLVTCQFCGVSVAEAALQQHNFWNLHCLQQQQEKSGRSARKAKKIARKVYELRQWKLNQVQEEVRRSIAARPGAKAMSKPPKCQKRIRQTAP